MKVVVLGSGSMGSAVANYTAGISHDTILWGRNKEFISALSITRENEKYLPGIKYSDKLNFSSDLDVCLDADIIIFAVPSYAVIKLLAEIKSILGDSVTEKHFIITSKGLDPVSSSFISDSLDKLLPEKNYLFMQGPSFSQELAEKLPTAFTLASYREDVITYVKTNLESEKVFFDISKEVCGIQLLGSLKNLFAIILGIAEGLNYEANTKSAIFVHCYQELCSFLDELGIDSKTVLTYAGIGDLYLTTTDNKSRNKRFGKYLGEGLTIADSLSKVGQVVEGYANHQIIDKFIQSNKLNSKAIAVLINILKEQISPKEGMSLILFSSKR